VLETFKRDWELLPIGSRLRLRHREGSRLRKEQTMGIVGWVILGLVAGAIAKAIHHGDEPAGILGALAVGVLGAILGGLIASAVGVGGIGSFFSLGTWLIAIGGSLLLLVIYNTLTGSRRRSQHTAT
jgi:uncharacterized membrane protein YeaQ/YmgE (transglycosylase-associated protein family)